MDRYFHQEPNASLLKASFILVDVNIGKFDRNKEVAKAYEVPPGEGRSGPRRPGREREGPLFSQKKGEFESHAASCGPPRSRSS